MIEIRIPKEITEYKEKFLFGLTVRQFISVAAALAVCVPLYIFSKDYIGDDGAGWLVLLIAAPIFGFGFVKFNGMTFEKLLMVIYRQKWKEPQKRKYIELPVFWEFREELISNELAKRRDFAKYSVRKKAIMAKAKSNKKKGCKREKVNKNGSGKQEQERCEKRKGKRQKAPCKAKKAEKVKEEKH